MEVFKADKISSGVYFKTIYGFSKHIVFVGFIFIVCDPPEAFHMDSPRVMFQKVSLGFFKDVILNDYVICMC